LILGLLSYGFTLGRSLQVANLTRDVGRMYVRGVDFSEQAAQELITGSASRPNLPALARGLGMQSSGGGAAGGTSGNGVLILSTYTRLSASCNCTNAGRIVLMRRVIVGNRNLNTAAYGNPAPGLVDSSTGMVKNYSNNATAQADGFSGVVNLASGELAYFVEARFVFPDLAVPGVLENPGVFWRAVF
jgi:hypothetical protein